MSTVAILRQLPLRALRGKAVLMVAWIYGWIGFHVPGGLIHILPVFAVVLLILHFVRGRDREADLRITR